MMIKKGDQVVIIAGAQRTKIEAAVPHRVLEVLADKNKLVVEGVNRVMRHVKKGHPKSPTGGRLQKEMPVDASNVMYYCESCRAPTRLALRYAENGSKERYCRKCNASAGVISPARPAYQQEAK